jgi:hypothetical protein
MADFFAAKVNYAVSRQKKTSWYVFGDTYSTLKYYKLYLWLAKRGRRSATKNDVSRHAPQIIGGLPFHSNSSFHPITFCQINDFIYIYPHEYLYENQPSSTYFSTLPLSPKQIYLTNTSFLVW